MDAEQRAEDRLSPEQEANYRERVAGGGFYRGGPVDVLLRELDATRAALVAEEALARSLAAIVARDVRGLHVTSHGWLSQQECEDPACVHALAALAAWRERHGVDGTP